MPHSKVTYPEGSLLFDVRYYKKPSEVFEVVYLNPLTQQLEVQYEPAIIDIWFLKEEYRTNKRQIAWTKMDQCYPIYCKPSQVSKMIAENIGGEWKEIYENYKDVMNPDDLKKKMCECPWVFKADFLPDVYYRIKWLQERGEECDITRVTFGLIDIETDVLDRNIDIKKIHEAPQPINAVTVIIPHVKICALLFLKPRPKDMIDEKFHPLLYKQQKAYNSIIKDIDGFKEEIRNYDEDNAKYLADYDIRIHPFDFNREIDLIKTVFDYINKYRPMFAMSWNAKFDHNYLYERINHLGYDPYEIIIPPEFKTRKLYYSEDKSDNKSFKTSKDWFFTSTYSVWLCQLRLFASMRKSQAERRSYGLSAVGKDIAGIQKIDSKQDTSFREFAYDNFRKFLLYNVRDVVVQLAIELQSGDTGSFVSRSFTYATQYSKCFQETHIVRNMREVSFEEDGYIQACRLIPDRDIDPQFKGAFVAPTEKNAYTGFILNGKKNNTVIYGAWDADAKAYYPSTKIFQNQDPMTLIYKCRIDNDVFRSGMCINRSMGQSYVWFDSKSPPKPHEEDMSGPIFNSYKNGNIGSLGRNFLNFPTITDCLFYLHNHFKKKK